MQIGFPNTRQTFHCIWKIVKESRLSAATEKLWSKACTNTARPQSATISMHLQTIYSLNIVTFNRCNLGQLNQNLSFCFSTTHLDWNYFHLINVLIDNNLPIYMTTDCIFERLLTENVTF